MNPLREARTAAGLTLKELSETAKVTITQLSKIERGLVNPYSPTKKKLESVLGSIDWPDEQTLTLDEAKDLLRFVRGLLIRDNVLQIDKTELDWFDLVIQNLSTKSSINKLMKAINQIDEKSNLKMFTFNADLPMADAENNHYLPVTLVIEDELPIIIECIDLLEQSHYLFNPNHFTLSSSNLNQDQVKAVFDLIIYVDSNFEKNNEN